MREVKDPALEVAVPRCNWSQEAIHTKTDKREFHIRRCQEDFSRVAKATGSGKLDRRTATAETCQSIFLF